MIARKNVRDLLQTNLNNCPQVLAAWVAGSAAFDRDDDFSDLDIGVLARAGGNAEVWEVLDLAFEELGGLEFCWNEPSPVFAGIDKRIFRPRGATEWFQVDVGIFPETATDLFNQPERHGRIRILFDHGNRLTAPLWDEAGHRRRLGEALHQNLMKWQAYRGWFRKELARGRKTDAFALYFHTSLVPLLAILGIRYRPTRWDFGLRYIDEEFPSEVAKVVAELCYVPSPEALQDRFADAERFLRRTILELRERGVTPIDRKGVDVPLLD